MLKQESTDTGTESQFIFTKNREDLAHKQTLSLVPVLHLVHYKSTHPSGWFSTLVSPVQQI